MLSLFSGGNAVPLRCDDYYIKELSTGLDELIFSLSIWDPDYRAIQEESSIREQSNDTPINYLVKAIDGGSDRATIKAQIDLDDWKSTMVIGYKSESATLGEIVNAVKPSGWSVVNNSGITYRRTVTAEAATPLEVLEQCRSTFSGCTFRFDNIRRIVTILNIDGGQNLGAFATRDLNLKQSEYKGKSTGFATRLYAYGKDGMSFASINGGKPYVENHTYSDRVICAYWSDERYTVPQNLLADAKARLETMAVPRRSFDCDIADLAAIDPEKYSFLSFPLFSVVSLIDETRSDAKIEHKVVERWRYPHLPEKNKVVFSTVPARIQSQVSQVIQSITNVNSEWNQQQAAFFNALTAAILGAKGGSVRLLDTDGDGEPDTLYIADSPDPSTAQKVWRFNYEGWGASQNGYNGPFVLGATFENGGTLNAFNLNVVNINGQNIQDKTIVTAALGDNVATERVLADLAVASSKLANNAVVERAIGTNAVINRCIASGSIYTSTCNAEIQGYFADVIETRKLYAGTASVGFLRAQVIKADEFALTNAGTPHKLIWNGVGNPITGG